MRMVCVDNDNEDRLTIGKVYDCVVANEYIIRTFNDICVKGIYFHTRFKTIEEYRDKKLKELGI